MSEEVSNSSTFETEEKNCEVCDEKMQCDNLSSHVKGCKIYGKFMEKTGDEYQCLICSQIHSERKSLYVHVEREHTKFVNISNGESDQIQNEAELSFDMNLDIEDDKNLIDVEKEAESNEKIIQVKFARSDNPEFNDQKLDFDMNLDLEDDKLDFDMNLDLEDDKNLINVEKEAESNEKIIQVKFARSEIPDFNDQISKSKI